MKEFVIYIAAVSSPGSFGVYTLDYVEVFASEGERSAWRHENFAPDADVNINYYTKTIQL